MECDFLNCDWLTFFSCGQICNNIDYDSSFAKVEKKMPSNGFLWWFLNILKNIIKDVAQEAFNALLWDGWAKAQTSEAGCGQGATPVRCQHWLSPSVQFCLKMELPT